MNNKFSAYSNPNSFTNENFQGSIYDNRFGLEKQHDSEGQPHLCPSTPIRSILPGNTDLTNEHVLSLLPESDPPQWISSSLIKPPLDAVDSDPFNLTDVEQPESLIDKQYFRTHQEDCMYLPGHSCAQGLGTANYNAPFQCRSSNALFPFLNYQNYQFPLGSSFEQHSAYLSSNPLVEEAFFRAVSPSLPPDCNEFQTHPPSPLFNCNLEQCAHPALSLNSTLSQCHSTKFPFQPPLPSRQDSQETIRGHGRSMPFSGDKGRILTPSEAMNPSTKPQTTIPELSPFLIAPKPIRYRRMLELNLDVCQRLWDRMEMNDHGQFSAPSNFELQGHAFVSSPHSPPCDWCFDSADNIHVRIAGPGVTDCDGSGRHTYIDG